MCVCARVYVCTVGNVWGPCVYSDVHTCKQAILMAAEFSDSAPDLVLLLLVLLVLMLRVRW